MFECLTDQDCPSTKKCSQFSCQAPEEERCDGLDNDLDGQTDETLLNACGQCDELPVEVCDELDNDCDGLTDEGFEEVGEQCEVSLDQGEDEEQVDGVWACVGGAVRCLPTGEQRATDEVCDGVDNDLDEQIDEELILSEVQCPSTTCRDLSDQRCEAGLIVNDCEVPLFEEDLTCDGVDDDCDGELDEDYLSVEVVCAEGCSFTGLTECVDEVVEDSCEQIRADNPDVCDGVDNDCDQEIDEGLNEWIDTEIECQQGVCQSTLKIYCEEGVETQVCADDPLLDPLTDPKNPIIASRFFDLCNGLDDDCDGFTDESSLDQEVLCESDPDEERPDEERPDEDIPNDLNPDTLNGWRVCEGGERVVEGCGVPIEERCNGRDDDRDGTVDEGFIGSEVECVCPPLNTSQSYRFDEVCYGVHRGLNLGVFVSSTFGDDESGSGLFNSPFASIGRAIEFTQAVAMSWPEELPRVIYVEIGRYEVEEYQVEGDLNIFGGFIVSMLDDNTLFWTPPNPNLFPSPQERLTTLYTESSVPIFSVLSSSSNLHLTELSIEIGDGFLGGGISSNSPTGLSLFRCSSSSLTRVLIEVGRGANGVDGASGHTPTLPVADGGFSMDNVPGEGGNNVDCCPNLECSGGRGGELFSIGESGSAPNGVVGGAGGTPPTLRGEDGGVGLPGTNGAPSPSYFGFFDPSTARWFPSNNEASPTDGTPGGGGGGGAGTSINQFPTEAGYGGGSGGCGGAAGQNGQNGGWSIGLILGVNCDLTSEQVFIKLSVGGDGGVGGAGGLGAEGNQGAPGVGRPFAGRGGNGGSGGCGGHGAGGYGGNMVGVILIDGVLPMNEEIIYEFSDQQASGGVGGRNDECITSQVGHSSEDGEIFEHICCGSESSNSSVSIRQCFPCNFK